MASEPWDPTTARLYPFHASSRPGPGDSICSGTFGGDDDDALAVGVERAHVVVTCDGLRRQTCGLDQRKQLFTIRKAHDILPRSATRRLPFQPGVEESRDGRDPDLEGRDRHSRP